MTDTLESAVMQLCYITVEGMIPYKSARQMVRSVWEAVQFIKKRSRTRKEREIVGKGREGENRIEGMGRGEFVEVRVTLGESAGRVTHRYQYAKTRSTQAL